MTPEYLLLIEDSFIAGTLLPVSSELVLQVMVAYSEKYNLPAAFSIAFLFNTLAIILNFVLIRLAVFGLENYSLVGENLQQHNEKPSAFFQKYCWPLLFLSFFGFVGALAVSFAGLFKVSAKIAIPLIVMSNAGYYIYLYILTVI